MADYCAFCVLDTAGDHAATCPLVYPQTYALQEMFSPPVFADRNALVAQIQALTAEVERLKQWIADLHSGMYVNCVYCGYRYGPRETTPVAANETTPGQVLKEHVEHCLAHPMFSLKRDLAEALRLAWEVVDSIPATYDEADPTVQRHARALVTLGEFLAPRAGR